MPNIIEDVSYIYNLVKKYYYYQFEFLLRFEPHHMGAGLSYPMASIVNITFKSNYRSILSYFNLISISFIDPRQIVYLISYLSEI